MYSELIQVYLADLIDLWVRSIPFIAPVVLGIILYLLWTWYIKLKFLSEVEWTLLEIKLPREIEKSPRSMEVIINSMAQTYEGNWYSRFTKGVSRTWFSLELVSIGGNVHFFIRTNSIFKSMIESQIYAQYPGVEIYEAPSDYAMDALYDREKTVKLWGAELTLSKPDPYPIKTYVDYKLDETGAEETQKTDPITPVIEFLGSLVPGEQAWIQILIMAAKDRKKKPHSWFEKMSWKDEGLQIVEKLMKRDKKSQATTPEGFMDFTKITLSPGEREVVEAIERSISKTGFDCGIRMIYMAEKDKYTLGNQLNLKNSFKQYNTANLNGFSQLMDTSFDYPWQDPFGNRTQAKRDHILSFYRARSLFYFPYATTSHAHPPFVLNTEELATIYHFPGGVATTPLIGRIPSKKAEPPTNLPI